MQGVEQVESALQHLQLAIGMEIGMALARGIASYALNTPGTGSGWHGCLDPMVQCVLVGRHGLTPMGRFGLIYTFNSPHCTVAAQATVNVWEHWLHGIA